MCLLLSVPGSMRAQITWESVHPVPEPSSWTDAAFGNGVWVVIGGNKILSTANFGGTWSVRSFGTNDNFDSVIWTGSRFIAVGQQEAETFQFRGWIVESSDVMTWTVVDDGRITATGQAEQQRLVDLAISDDGQTIVAGGFQGTLFRSTDGGETWEGRIYQPDTDDGHAQFGLIISSVAYGNGTFAFTQNGTGLLLNASTDGGVTWNQTLLEGAGGSDEIAFGGGQWIISAAGNAGVTSSVLFNSSDAVEWTSRELPGGTGTFYDLAYLDGVWVAAAAFPSVPFSSEDGVTWTQRQNAVTTFVRGAGAGDGKFLILGDGTVQWSEDGATWLALAGELNARLYGAAYANGAWLALGDAGTILKSDDDGATWMNVSPGGTNGVRAATHDGSKWVAIGQRAWTSADGESWTQHSLGGLFPSMNAVVHAGGQFVAVGETGAIRISSDGESWTAPAAPNTATYEAIASDGTQFIAAGQNFFGGFLIASADATTWEDVSPEGTRKLHGIVHGLGRFVAAGDGQLFSATTIYTSTDGRNWESADVGMSGDLIFDGSQFLILGQTSFSSKDGLNWTEAETENYSIADGAAYGNGNYIAVGRNAGIYRAMAIEGSSGGTIDPILGGTPVEGLEGWFFSDWLGFYNTAFVPWLFHAQHGLLFRAEGSTDESTFIFDLSMSAWWWTNTTTYPFLFAFNPQPDSSGTDVDTQWLFYFEETSAPRVFAIMTGSLAGQNLFFDP